MLDNGSSETFQASDGPPTREGGKQAEWKPRPLEELKSGAEVPNTIQQWFVELEERELSIKKHRVPTVSVGQSSHRSHQIRSCAGRLSMVLDHRTKVRSDEDR